MEYSSKNQSWFEYINQSIGNNIKNEIIDQNVNEMNHQNYPMINTNFSHSPIQTARNDLRNSK